MEKTTRAVTYNLAKRIHADVVQSGNIGIHLDWRNADGRGI